MSPHCFIRTNHVSLSKLQLFTAITDKHPGFTSLPRLAHSGTNHAGPLLTLCTLPPVNSGLAVHYFTVQTFSRINIFSGTILQFYRWDFHGHRVFFVDSFLILPLLAVLLLLFCSLFCIPLFHFGSICFTGSQDKESLQIYDCSFCELVAWA